MVNPDAVVRAPRLSARQSVHSGPKNGALWPFQRHEYPFRFRTKLPSTTAALNRAVRKVLRVARTCGCVTNHRANLEIALREALANAMIHGNSLGRDKRIYLRCYGGPQSAIVILVRDEGSGFDPTDVPDPREGERIFLESGRGLLLMRELMDHVEYRKGGREVMLYSSCNGTAG